MNYQEQYLNIAYDDPDDAVLFVADRNNNCIRIIYLLQNITKTYAGKCG